MERAGQIQRIGRVAVTTVETGRWRTNCYLVRAEDSREAVIIDPGDDARTVLEALGDLRATAVICTHGHYDHLGAAAEVCASAALPLLIDERDVTLAERAPLYALTFEQRRLAPPGRIEAFRAPTSFPLAGLELSVLPAPGHTLGSVVAIVDGAVFSGDTLLRERLGRTDLPGGDPRALEATIDRLLRSLDDELVLFPGHGAAWTLREARAWWRGRGAAAEAT